MSVSLGRLLAVHSRQQPFQRQVAQLADGQPEGTRTGADGGVAQLSLPVGLNDLPDRLAVEVRDAGEIFLVPAALFHQARNLFGKLGVFRWRVLVHVPDATSARTG